MPTPDPAADLAILAQQEALLRFPAFNLDTAWQLGTLLREALIARNAGGREAPGCTAEIELANNILFTCTTPGATPNQANWIRRKRNTVRHFARSSYAIGRQLELDNQTLESRHGLPLADYAAHGGGFPLHIADAFVGTIILSGLPQRDDHTLVATTLSTYLNIPIPQLP
jgi:uncharacterized protein (UPF0303 family)